MTRQVKDPGPESVAMRSAWSFTDIGNYILKRGVVEHGNAQSLTLTYSIAHKILGRPSCARESRRSLSVPSRPLEQSRTAHSVSVVKRFLLPLSQRRPLATLTLRDPSLYTGKGDLHSWRLLDAFWNCHWDHDFNVSHYCVRVLQSRALRELSHRNQDRCCQELRRLTTRP